MLHLSSSTLAASNDHSMHHSLTQCHKPLDYATSSRAPMCRRPGCWVEGGGEAESKVGSKGEIDFECWVRSTTPSTPDDGQSSISLFKVRK